MLQKRKIFSLSLAALLLLSSANACNKGDSASSGNALVPGTSSVNSTDSASAADFSEGQGSASTDNLPSDNQAFSLSESTTSSLPAGVPSDAEVLSATFLGVMDYGEPETKKENADMPTVPASFFVF